MISRLSLLRICFFFCIAVLSSQCERKPPAPAIVIEAEPTVTALINTFLDGGGTYKDVSFAEVIKASSGNRVIPLDPNDQADAVILDEIGYALDALLVECNGDDSLTNDKQRVSEVSPLIESKLKQMLARAPGFSCGEARTKEGNLQRAGYPDLKMVHEDSGRVIYIDPKLVASDALSSSLRTFYFTPRGDSGKVLVDAHHLLVGIEYDGVVGDLNFLSWHLVDLYHSKVRLKAEFQAINKDLYQPELTLRRGTVAK